MEQTTDAKLRGKLRFPRDKSHAKIVDRLRELTPRKSGDSLEFTIRRLNRTLVGWFNYFRHCHWSIFREYDGFIRRRLRSLLVKRHRLNPRRQSRTHRWPNEFFAKQGLYSLCEAHLGLVQSLAGNY